MASICQLLNLPEIPDRRHISLAQNQSSPSVPFQKRTLFERSTTLRDDRCCSHAYMLPRYEHTHFLPQYWSGQNRTSRTACAGPDMCVCIIYLYRTYVRHFGPRVPPAVRANVKPAQLVQRSLSTTKDSFGVLLQVT